MLRNILTAWSIPEVRARLLYTLGAMAGAAVGVFINQYAPFPAATPGAYALVGMGALFAGIVRAPLTSVIMIFEVTQDYEILVPLMIANLLAFYIARRYQPLPLYEALLVQDGVELRKMPPGPPPSSVA